MLFILSSVFKFTKFLIYYIIGFRDIVLNYPFLSAMLYSVNCIL